jgi:hypothetical protein
MRSKKVGRSIGVFGLASWRMSDMLDEGNTDAGYTDCATHLYIKDKGG